MTTNNLVNNTKQYIAGIHQFITVGTGSTDVSIADIISQPDVNLMTLQNGNVGIGTINPTSTLHVIGNILSTGTVTASNVSVIGDFVTLNTITSNTEQMVITNAGTGPALKVTQTGDNSVAEFYDNESGIALFVGNNGNVGIGTDAPLAPLHIMGSILITAIGSQSNPIICISDLYDKPAGNYYVRWTNGIVSSHYWDGMWLKVHEEGLNANNFTSYWSNSTTFYMNNFGGLGSGYGHGWPSSGSLTSAQNNTLTIPYLPKHSFARYFVRWHTVDSIDNELNELRLYDIHNVNNFNVFWNATRTMGTTSFTTNNVYYFTSSSWTLASYTYTPWSNGAAGYYHGYFTIDTNTVWHTTNTFKALHYTGTDQFQSDEAVYFTHSTLYLR